jgi:phage repressor protein C with HTH and peptisase S24 domain
MLRLHRITGESLLPTHRPGDFVVSSRLPYLFRPIRQGDLIVFRHRDHGVMIKRVAGLRHSDGRIIVSGTNPDSIDSRQFGTIEAAAVIGKVIWHVRAPR